MVSAPFVLLADVTAAVSTIPEFSVARIWFVCTVVLATRLMAVVSAPVAVVVLEMSAASGWAWPTNRSAEALVLAALDAVRTMAVVAAADTAVAAAGEAAKSTCVVSAPAVVVEAAGAEAS